MESTYGNRSHPAEETESEIADVINSTAQKGGVLVIPAFALGRTQTLLYVIRELKAPPGHPGPADIRRQPDGD